MKLSRRLQVAAWVAALFAGTLAPLFVAPAGADQPVGADADATVSAPANVTYGQVLNLTASLTSDGVLPYAGQATLQIDITGATLGNAPSGCSKTSGTEIRCSEGVPSSVTIPAIPAAAGTPVHAIASEQGNNNDLNVQISGDTDECEPPASGGAPTSSNCSTSTTTVLKATSSMTLAAAPNPATFGSAVTYTATITPTTATGTVAFSDNGVAIAGCAAQTVTSGKATCTTSPSVGSHPITAAYAGDPNDTASSASATETVNNVSTSTSLSSSSNPVAVGVSVTYTATVSPSTATGTVAFADGGTAITGCTAQPVSAGTATCSQSYGAAGTHSIVASYGGSVGYAPSTSNTISESVFANAVAGGGSTSFTASDGSLNESFQNPSGDSTEYVTLDEATVNTNCGSSACLSQAAEALFTGSQTNISASNPLLLTIQYNVPQHCDTAVGGNPGGCSPIYWIGSGQSTAQQVQKCPTYTDSRHANAPNPAIMTNAAVPCLNFIQYGPPSPPSNTYRITYQVALTKDIVLPLLGTKTA